MPPCSSRGFTGIKNDDISIRIQKSLLSFKLAEEKLTTDHYIEASNIYRSARRRGITIRSSIDCSIAVIAIQEKIQLWHRIGYKEFNFKGAKRGARLDPETAKVSVTARLDSDVVAWLRKEATRLGLPYQTLLNSLLKQSMSATHITEEKVREIVREELTRKAS